MTRAREETQHTFEKTDEQSTDHETSSVRSQGHADRRDTPTEPVRGEGK
jgi:hypothetical protein